jgi:hypothetical protein
LWAGLTFFGLVLALVRPFLPVHLTEPWGLIWALVAVPFLIHGLRPRGGLARTFAIGATCFSLLARMGSMFTLPAMVAWALWADHRDGVRRMASLAAVGLALALPVAINASLARLYGSDTAMTGSNFAHVLCGLAHGGNFATCAALYADEFENLLTETDVARAHLGKAATRFMADPWTFVNRLAEGERHFLENVQVAMLYGYRFQDSAPFFPRFLWYFVGAIGLVWLVVRGKEPYELSFWMVMSLSLLASVPWVMFDEGWRVLSGSFVLIALLAASGFSTPAAVVARAGQREVVRMCRRSAIAVGALVCLWFVIPALAYRVDALDAHSVTQQIAGPNEAIILGGRHLPAFLVVPDDRSVPTSFPAMRFSDFQKVIEASDIEQYQKLLVPALAGRAFGFAMSPGPSRPGAIFITPPEVVSNRDAKAWKLRLSESDVLHGPRFFLAEEAEPLRLQGR